MRADRVDVAVEAVRLRGLGPEEAGAFDRDDLEAALGRALQGMDPPVLGGDVDVDVIRVSVVGGDGLDADGFAAAAASAIRAATKRRTGGGR